jgi:GPH family glycoside/pentoside/hexuronide:cation symporter
MDKGPVFIIGCFSWLVILLAISGVAPNQIALAYLLAALSGAGIANAYVLPWSMIPDVVDYDQLKTGQRREGSYYAFAAFFQKMATGAAIWLMGQALALAHYINPTAADPVPVQPDQAVQAIRLFMGPVPAVLLLLSVLFAWRYPITREKLRQMSEQLAVKSRP